MVRPLSAEGCFPGGIKSGLSRDVCCGARLKVRRSPLGPKRLGAVSAKRIRGGVFSPLHTRDGDKRRNFLGIPRRALVDKIYNFAGGFPRVIDWNQSCSPGDFFTTPCRGETKSGPLV